jgi:hypothetical protein
MHNQSEQFPGEFAFPRFSKRAEVASTEKRKYRNGKYQSAHVTRMENASTVNSSTNLQGWKTQVWQT